MIGRRRGMTNNAAIHKFITPRITKIVLVGHDELVRRPNPIGS